MLCGDGNEVAIESQPFPVQRARRRRDKEVDIDAGTRSIFEGDEELASTIPGVTDAYVSAGVPPPLWLSYEVHRMGLLGLRRFQAAIRSAIESSTSSRAALGNSSPVSRSPTGNRTTVAPSCQNTWQCGRW